MVGKKWGDEGSWDGGFTLVGVLIVFSLVFIDFNLEEMSDA